MAPEVGAVGKRLVINLKDDIVNVPNVLNIGSESHVLGNLNKTRVVVGNTQLSLGAAHTVGGISRKRSGSDGNLAYSAANGSKRNPHTLAHVGSTANDVHNLVALVNLKQVKLL